MWCVDAWADDESGVYTYLVDGPADANDEEIAVCAYARHGILFAKGDVAHMLGDTYIVFWKEALTYEPVDMGSGSVG